MPDTLLCATMTSVWMNDEDGPDWRGGELHRRYPHSTTQSRRLLQWQSRNEPTMMHNQLSSHLNLNLFFQSMATPSLNRRFISSYTGYIGWIHTDLNLRQTTPTNPIEHCINGFSSNAFLLMIRTDPITQIPVPYDQMRCVIKSDEAGKLSRKYDGPMIG